MDRRRFMKRGLLGGALLLLVGGGGLAALPGKRAPRPGRHLAVLDDAAFPVLVAVAARVLQGTSADPVAIAHGVDEALRRAAPEGQRDLNRVLLLLENALPGLLLRGSVLPFTSMDARAQDAALLAWRDSRATLLRGAYQALRKLCLAAHYASPSSWASIGYRGPILVKSPPPPIAAREPLSAPFRPDQDGGAR